ncbi:tripartite motif-containing protein 14 isoform X2 [Phoca vitulina]|uniref:tripartite motif-containing protein 14 isoform X2 n=1 Tax=Phoca vitulina TaxID=9720 RepID=UPI0013960501|nr:tripartite motif-containing protein 14 isoform X2 [Phoca vitulina]
MAGAGAQSGTPGEPGPAEREDASGWRCPEHGDRVAELFCRRCRRCVCALCPVLGAHRGHPVGLALEEAVHVQKLIQECLKQLEAKKHQQVGNITQIEEAAEKLKEYRAVEQELQKQMSLGELCYPEPLSFEPVKSFFKGLVDAMQSMLRTPLDVRLKENTNCQLSGSTSTKLVSLLKTSPSPERSLFLKYARTPTLEPDTMHARLRLSADRLTVRCGLVGRLGPTPALRFDKLWQVLGRDCYAAGRHYWEVDVQEAGVGWWVGVAYASLRRCGASAAARLGCNRQSWCLKRYDLEYWAFHDGQRSRLRPRDDPDRLGVFLDYEAGVLSFYDVSGGMSHLHTFRATFQEPLYPALRLWEGAISIPRLP